MIRSPRRWKGRRTRRRRLLRIDNWLVGAWWRRRWGSRRLPLLKHTVARDESRTSKVLRRVRGVPSRSVLPRGVPRPEWEDAANKVDYRGLLVDHVLDLHASTHRLRRRVAIRELEPQVRRDGSAVLDARFDVGGPIALTRRPVRDRQTCGGRGAGRRQRRRARRQRRRAENRSVGQVVPLVVRYVALRSVLADVLFLALVRNGRACISCFHRRNERCTVRAVCSQFAKKEGRTAPSVVALAVVREEQARVVAAVGGGVAHQPAKPMASQARIGRRRSQTASSRRWVHDTRAHLTIRIRRASARVVVKRVAMMILRSRSIRRVKRTRRGWRGHRRRRPRIHVHIEGPTPHRKQRFVGVIGYESAVTAARPSDHPRRTNSSASAPR